MSFLRNFWYAAAWSSEVGNKPLCRKILGEEITFYRAASGKAVGVASRCPHRFAPLYYGDVVGENIKCRYHGLEFAPNGACVVNPDGSTPPRVGIKAYTVAEKDAMLWIWMGEKPAGTLPAHLSAQPSWGGRVDGHLHIDCNFQFLTDNLLDNAHAPHLHPAFRTEGHIKTPRGEVHQDGDAVICKLHFP